MAELGVGDFFGEMALRASGAALGDGPRAEPVETYTLTADDFAALLENSHLADTFREAATARADRLASLGSGRHGRIATSGDA